MNKLIAVAIASIFTFIIIACTEKPDPSEKSKVLKAQVSASRLSVEDETDLEAELIKQEIEYEEEMAKIDLLEVIDALAVAERKMKRQARIWQWSQTRYMEKLRILETNFALLEGRGTPGIFAGEVPEKDVYSYLEYIDTCEEVLELLEVALLKDKATQIYVYDLTSIQTRKWEEMRTTILSTITGFDNNFPSTGSAIQDAFYTMSSKEYAAYSQQVTKSTIKLVAQRTGKSIDEVEKLLKGESEIGKAVQSEVTKLMADQLLNFKPLDFGRWFNKK